MITVELRFVECWGNSAALNAGETPLRQKIGQMAKPNLTESQTNARMSEDWSDGEVESDEIADKCPNVRGSVRS